MYWRVSPKIWTEPWDDDTRVLALYLLTCPHRTTEGLFRLPKAYICADLGWTEERLRQPFGQLLSEGFIRYDERARVVLIVNALKYQTLENPNQVEAALRRLADLPQTPLLQDLQLLAERFCQRLAQRLAERFGKPISIAIAIPSPMGKDMYVPPVFPQTADHGADAPSGGSDDPPCPGDGHQERPEHSDPCAVGRLQEDTPSGETESTPPGHYPQPDEPASAPASGAEAPDHAGTLSGASAPPGPRMQRAALELPAGDGCALEDPAGDGPVPAGAGATASPPEQRADPAISQPDVPENGVPAARRRGRKLLPEVIALRDQVAQLMSEAGCAPQSRQWWARAGPAIRDLTPGARDRLLDAVRLALQPGAKSWLVTWLQRAQFADICAHAAASDRRRSSDADDGFVKFDSPEYLREVAAPRRETEQSGTAKPRGP